jgi:alginate O-acetyltransferase complex protein AlgI
VAFNSFSYFLFLPIVFLVYYFSRDSLRWLVLLISSFAFYAALKAPHLIVILLLVTTISYSAGIQIERSESQKAKSWFLWGGIAANVLILSLLKYLPFLTQNINSMIRAFAALNLSLHDKPTVSYFVLSSGTTAIVSIGASYFIFQAISYLIDIYLEVEKPERHFGQFALYMSFFPKLLQGPIERAGDLLPQLKQPYVFNYGNVRAGLLLFVWGLFKKMVIADRLAGLVDPVYNNVHGYGGFSLLLATYYYALQLYFDFSGYTDMALGTAGIFNIKLTQNFNKPYLATSIADFWRRWHISFSRWILDYIFKPLQISLRYWGTWGVASALLVTFFVSGVWHGASWGYIVWGLLHGFYMASAVIYKPIQKKIHKYFKVNTKSVAYKAWQVFFTFHLVCFAWIFFRANTITDAHYVIHQIFGSLPSFHEITDWKYGFTLGKGEYEAYRLVMVFALFITFGRYIGTLAAKPVYVRWFFYNMISCSILFIGVYDNTKFIYNRF